MPKKLWVEAYRPTTLDDYLFQNNSHKERINKFVKDKSIPNLLLAGHRGTGKTTLARILKNELEIADGDFKTLNASDDNSVDIIRTTIKSFSQTMPLGDFKVVFLDEADYLTINAQAALRGMMEEYSDTVRFILTCNRVNKIIPELASRCQEFRFDTFNKKEMTKRAATILQAEKVKIKDKNIQILKDYVDDAYPDMRKLLQNLEGNVIDGVLQEQFEVSGKVSTMVNIIEELNKGKWMQARESIIQSVEDGDWEDIYRFLYDHLDEIEGFNNDPAKWSSGIIVIADALHRHALVADPEINFSACMIKLSRELTEE